MNPEKKRRVPLFLLVTALYWFALYAYVPTLSTYAIKIGASLSMVGLISGSYGLMQLIARLPIGILSDRFRQRKLYIILGLGFTALAAAGMMALRTPVALLIFRAVSGIAASMWVAFTVLYSGYFSPEKSVKAIGVINAVNLVGQSLANFLGGALNEAFSTDYAGFWLAVIAGVIGFALSFFIFEDRGADDGKEPIRLIDLADVAANKALIVTSLLAIVAQFISFSAIISFAPVLAKDLGASDAQLGLLSMIATIPGIFTSMLAGSALTRKFGEKVCVVAGLAGAAVCCALYPVTHSLIGLFIVHFFCGGFRQMALTLLMGLSIKTIAPEKKATAMGFFQAVYSLGMFLGPVILGRLGDTAGLTVGYLVVAGISAAAAIAAALTLGDYAKPAKNAE